MAHTKKLPLTVIIISFCFTLLVFLNTRATTKEVESGKKIVIKFDFIPSGVKPGEKPITLAPDLLHELLPELKNPRLMRFEDLGDPHEQEGFIEEGFTFVLRGDFNRDGVADLAFVGKYDNPEHPKENTFIVVVSFKEKMVIRDFFSKIPRDRASLLLEPRYKPKIDAIFISYTYASDDCEFLYWNRIKYEFDPCKAVFP